MATRRQKPTPKRPVRAPAPKKAARPKPKTPAKPAPKAAARPAPKAPAKPASGAKSSGASAKTPEVPLEVPLPGGRRHVLSLSFVRDGDEFLARLETDTGHITELKNRSLDQLLTLVASELEDLLE
jgi:outer membrane biosynthesis protein TonB